MCLVSSGGASFGVQTKVEGTSDTYKAHAVKVGLQAEPTDCQKVDVNAGVSAFEGTPLFVVLGPQATNLEGSDS